MIFKENDLIDINGLLRKFDTALKMVAEEVGEEIQQTFVNAISSFYASYSPTSYDRTLSMYSFSSGYSNAEHHLPLHKKNGRLDYSAGIQVGPEFVKGNPYAKSHGINVNPEWVFDVSYMKGIHGFNRQNIIGQRNNKLKPENGPTEDNDNFRDYWEPRTKKKDNLWEPGYYKTAKWDFSRRPDNYSVWDHVPTTTIPPDIKMKRGFKEIKKNISAKVDTIMNQLL